MMHTYYPVHSRTTGVDLGWRSATHGGRSEEAMPHPAQAVPQCAECELSKLFEQIELQ